MTPTGPPPAIRMGRSDCDVIELTGALLRLDAGDADRFRPKRYVRRNCGGKFLRAVADRVDTEICKALDESRVFGRALDLPCKLVDDRLRSPGGCHQSVPGDGAKPGVAGFCDRRNVGELRASPFV